MDKKENAIATVKRYLDLKLSTNKNLNILVMTFTSNI